jgi:hypothetical protein
MMIFRPHNLDAARYRLRVDPTQTSRSDLTSERSIPGWLAADMLD